MRRCLLLISILAWSAPALAHDPPYGNGIWKAGERILVRTNRGLIVSHDGGKSWLLLCNEALGINTSEVPALIPRQDGSYLIGTSHGVLSASEDLCTVAPVATLDAVAVPALASDGSRIYASTGQSGFDNGLYRSNDDGKTFAAFGELAQDRIYERVLVSSDDEKVLYASGLRQGAMDFLHIFARSSDSGATFTEHQVELHDDEYSFVLLGADPSAADGAIYAAARAELGLGVPDRLLVSRDAGTSWSDPLKIDRIGAFALAPDGKRVWVGGRPGLWRSDDAGEHFTQVAQIESDCATLDGSRLYVCDARTNLAGVSYSDDGGATLTSLMQFTDVTSMVPCAFDSKVAIACSGPWGDWQRELALGFVPDAGAPVPDAGPPDASLGNAADAGGPSAADAGGPAHAKSACSCSVLGAAQRDFHGTLSWLLGAGLALAIRRRWRLSRGR